MYKELQFNLTNFTSKKGDRLEELELKLINILYDIQTGVDVISDITKSINSSRPTVTKYLDILEQLGFITKQPSRYIMF